MTTWLTDRIAVLGGADLTTLRAALTQRPAFVQMAVVLVSTASIGGLSMWFALTTAVGVGHTLATFLAVAWGLVILNLDRFLTLSMSGHGWRLLALALPRLFLALVIGVVVSTPLVLQVFRSDIAFALARDNGRASAQNETIMANSLEQKEVVRLTNRVAQLTRQRSGVDVVPQSAELTTATARLTDLRAQLERQRPIADQALKLYICERYGTGRESLKDPNTCSPKPGLNGPYAQIEANNRQQAATLAALQAQVDAAQQDRDLAYARAVASSTADQAAHQGDLDSQLAQAQADLATAISDRDHAAQELKSRTVGNVGLLAQIKALYSSDDKTLRLTHELVALLFVLIELLPVIVKLMRAAAGSTSYDVAFRHREDQEKTVALFEAQAERTIAREKFDTVVAVESDLRNRERKIGIDVNDVLAERVREVVVDHVGEWAQNVKATFVTPPAPPVDRHGWRSRTRRLRRILLPDPDDL